MKKSNNQSNQTTTQSMLGGDGGVKTREQEAREPKRPPRVPMSQGTNLHCDESLLDRENFAYRYHAEYKDKGGTISSAHAAYWEHVTDSNGNNITRNGGGGDMLYLMRLPMQYHLEDLELNAQRNRATMDQEYRVKDGQYVPKGSPGAVKRETKTTIA